MTTRLTGLFQITGWDETAYRENADGSKQTNAKITQTYQGDIKGTSELQHLMSYSSNGSAVFVGIETIVCSINGKSGNFVIQHKGKFEAGTARSDFSIVPDSGKDEFEGIKGTGSFTSAENGQASYILEINSK